MLKFGSYSVVHSFLFHSAKHYSTWSIILTLNKLDILNITIL